MRLQVLSLFLIHVALIHDIVCVNVGHADPSLDSLLPKFENLEEKLQEYEEKSRRQENEIKMLKRQILQNKEENNFRSRRESELPVAFYGKMIYPHQNLSNSNTLKFSKMVTNVGAPYNNNTGHFIAPLPGIYVFSMTVMIEDNDDAHVGIYVNDKVMTRVKLYGSEHQCDTMSQTAIFKLGKYDSVSVRRYEGTQIINSEYTSFSGFLLQQYDQEIFIG